jgi:tripartite-type tricarboxylate transporter receptor subunit TctC
MKPVLRRSTLTKIAAGMLAAAMVNSLQPACAQQAAWPNKPIRMIVPYTPGGYTDYMARTVGQKLGENLGVPIVFDNRPGANSILGADLIAKAPPDGYTFGTVIAAHAVNATLYAGKLPYDVMKDFTYVTLLSVAPLLLVATPSLPANNLKEVLAYGRAHQGELNFASSGTGAAAHLTMEMLKMREGLSMTHIPYKGTAGALQDTIGGQVNLMFDTVGPLMVQVRAGKLKAIAVTAKARMVAAPDVPTMEEAGERDFVTGTWAGLVAPAGVPKEIVNRVASEVQKILRDPAMRDKLAQQGYEGIGNTPEEYEKFMREEIARWAKVIKDSGTKVE